MYKLGDKVEAKVWGIADGKIEILFHNGISYCNVNDFSDYILESKREIRKLQDQISQYKADKATGFSSPTLE